MDDETLINVAEEMYGDEAHVEGLGVLPIPRIAQLARQARASRGTIPVKLRTVLARKVATPSAKACPAPKLRQRTIVGDTLYCRRSLPNAALAVDSKLKVFHVGPGQDRSGLGYAAGADVDEVHTNLGDDGRLPTEESFIVYGYGVRILSDVAADRENIRQNVRFFWRQSNNQEIKLFQPEKTPPKYRQSYKVAGSTDVVLYEEVGPIFMQKKPLFTITGQENPGDRAYGYFKVLRGFTPSVATEIEVQLYGRSTQNI